MKSDFTSRCVLVSLAAASLVFRFTPRAHGEVWDGPDTGGLWNGPSNWNPDTVPDAVAASAIFNNPLAANRTVLLGEDITIGSLTFNNSSAFTNTISAATETPILTFDTTGSGPATITVTGNNTLTGNANPNAIRGRVVLNDDIVISVEPTASAVGALTFLGSGSPGSQISGPGGITKIGTGGLTFADTAKIFTGPLIINEGKLRLNAAGRVTATASVTVASGGQLNLDAGTAAGINNFTFGPTGGPGANTPVITLNGTGIASGPFAAFPGALRKDNTSDAQLDNPIVLQSPTAINVAAGGLRLTNVVGGSGSLTMGALPGSATLQPTLTLLGDNTYSGGTVALSGTVVISGATADLGSGNVTIDAVSTLTQGATTFTANGRLTIETGVVNAISDSATLTLTGGSGAGNGDGGFATLNPGVNEVVGGLVLAGVMQGIGTYGSTSSAATFRNDEFFAGTGIVTVIPEPAAASLLFASFGALLVFPRFRRSAVVER